MLNEKYCDTASHADDSLASNVSPPQATPLTYAGLLRHGCELLASEGLRQQQVRNTASALRGWIAFHGFVAERAVGDDFTTDFDRLFLRYCDGIAKRLAKRTQRDRQEQMLRWRRITETVRHRDTLPTTFSGALACVLRASPLAKMEVARQSGIDVKAIVQWSTGESAPRRVSLAQLSRLESVLELPKGALIGRLPFARRARYERVGTLRKPDSFAVLRRAQLKRVGHYSMKFTPRLQEQWQGLLRLKTDPLRDHARARNTWRLKPIHRTGMMLRPPMMFDGQVCATAAVHWNFVSCYLGWLALPVPEGLGMAVDAADTLGWLARPDLVIRYANWRINFSDRKFHNGVNCLLQIVESYLRRETGFIWLRPDLRETVPDLKLSEPAGPASDSSAATRWQYHCEDARRKIREFHVRVAETMGIRMSRNPTERISNVLHDLFPLKRLVEFVERLERSAPPPAHERSYFAWIRDVTLCRMLISNPLRINQYAVMTFRPDGTGNLVRVGKGRYRIRFDAADFKNEKGAAREPYDVEVDASVCPWIDRYLLEARPHLIDATETDRFFLPAAVGTPKPRRFLEDMGLTDNRGWTGTGMLSRIRVLTQTYIDGCPGFGPHAFRHIIATDHLRRHPGDYLTVATLLHDKLETVLTNYGHLRVADGLRVLSSGIREATQQLSDERKSR